LEEFISVKGIKAIGNQLTPEKIKTVNILESLPYEPPIIEEVEVRDEEVVDSHSNTNDDSDSNQDEKSSTDEEGQITMF